MIINFFKVDISFMLSFKFIKSKGFKISSKSKIKSLSLTPFALLLSLLYSILSFIPKQKNIDLIKFSICEILFNE